MGVVDGNHLYQIKTVARQMNDEFTVTPVSSDPTVETESKTLSVVDYVKAVLAGNYSNAIKAMLVDMLIYGSEAQDYLGYKTDAKAFDALTPTEQAYASDYSDAQLAEEVGSASSTAGSASYTRITGAYPQFADNANIVLVVRTEIPADELSVYADGLDITDNAICVQTAENEVQIVVPQNITQVKTMQNFQVIAADGASNIIRYSIGTYCVWAMGAAASSGDVSRALLTFGTSAIAAL